MSQAGQCVDVGTALDQAAISQSHHDQVDSPSGNGRTGVVGGSTVGRLPTTRMSDDHTAQLAVSSKATIGMTRSKDMSADTAGTSGSLQRVHPADILSTDSAGLEASIRASGAPQRQSSASMVPHRGMLSHRHTSSGQATESPGLEDFSAVSTPASEDIKRLVIADGTPTSQDSTMDSSNGPDSESDSDYMWEQRDSERKGSKNSMPPLPTGDMSEMMNATQTGDVLVECPGTTLRPLPIVEMAQSHSTSPQILKEIETQVAATAGGAMHSLLTGQHLNGSLSPQNTQDESLHITPARTPSYHQSTSASSYTSLIAEQDDISSFHLAKSSGEHVRHLGPPKSTSRPRTSQQYDGLDRSKQTNWSQEHLGPLPDGSVGSATVSAAQRQASRALPSTSVTDRSPMIDRQRIALAQTQEPDGWDSSKLGHAHGHDVVHFHQPSRGRREDPAYAGSFKDASTSAGAGKMVSSASDMRTNHTANGTRHSPDTLVQKQSRGTDSPEAAMHSAGQSKHDQTHEQRLRPEVMHRQESSSSQQHVNGASSKSERDRSANRRQLGEWTLGKTLGAGSMGKVKLGVSNRDGHKFAIKIIPRFTSTAAAQQQAAGQTGKDGQSNGVQPSSRDANVKASGASGTKLDPNSALAKAQAKDLSKEIRTIREGAIVMLLHHPYIAGLKHTLVYPNYYYMVFEYVNGGQMLDYIISHGRLRERAARKFARQICSALEYCHANSIVHRDLKIENILISKSGNIKIIDFGLSNLFSPHGFLATFCGSLYFAAPELLNAKYYTGPEVDIWSFGIVLYVLVCGKVPFDDQNMPALHAKIKRGQVEYPTWLSTECRHLLSRMLTTNPANRATMLEVAQHAWMTKGFDSPPNAHLPYREPIRFGQLDRKVLDGMTGFEFGTSDEIEAKMNEVLTSDLYLSAVNSWDEAKSGKTSLAHRNVDGSTTPRDTDATTFNNKIKNPSRRFSGLGFYGKRLAGNVAAAFGAKPEEHINDAFAPAIKNSLPHTVGAGGVKTDLTDPTKSYHPLLSIYYLVKERLDRNQLYGEGLFAPSNLSLTGPIPPPPMSVTIANGMDTVDQAHSSFVPVPSVSLAAPPTAAIAGRGSMAAPVNKSRPPIVERSAVMHSSPTADETAMTKSLSQQRAGRGTSAPFSAPSTPSGLQGGFRRTAPQTSEVTEATRDRPSHSSSPPPPMHRHSTQVSRSAIANMLASSAPATSAAVDAEAKPNALREDTPLSPSQPSLVRRFGSMLGRSDDKKTKQRNSLSLSSPFSSFRDRSSSAQPSHPPVAFNDLPLASPDLDTPITLDQPAAGVTRASTTAGTLGIARGHTRGVSLDAGSQNMGSPPRAEPRRNTSVSVAGRRPKTAASGVAGALLEEDESTNSGGANEAAQGSEATFVAESKPVYLKGLFSVSTTSTKSATAIKESIGDVLERLSVQHRVIKAGFECVHAPSIDLNSIAFSPRPDHVDRAPMLGSSPESPSLDRRRSSRKPSKRSLPRSPFSKEKDLEKEDVETLPTLSTAAERGTSSHSLAPQRRPGTSSSGSFTFLSQSSAVPQSLPTQAVSLAEPPRTPTSPRPTKTQQALADVQIPMDAADMILRFEIFIIKVPWLPGLHGIQFRRISGSAWQYSQLARTILNELKL